MGIQKEKLQKLHFVKLDKLRFFNKHIYKILHVIGTPNKVGFNQH